MTRPLTLLCVAALVALASACGGKAAGSGAVSTRTAAPVRDAVDTSVLRRGSSDLLTDYLTPAQAATRSAVTFTGTVEGFAPGRTVTVGDQGPQHLMVMRTRVDRTIRGSKAFTAAGRVYVELAAGNISGARQFSEAIPPGTRVIVFGSDRLAYPAHNNGDDIGHPAGTRLLSAKHPQSLLLEGTAKSSPHNPRLLGGIEDLANYPEAWQRHTTLDAFVADLEKALKN